jgi:GPH family glycoside/pentoside/hexuronide:cation symporter
MGQALAITGYITPETSGALPVQPESAIQAIRVFTGPVPAVLLTLAVFFAWNYPITRESHEATLQELSISEAAD